MGHYIIVTQRNHHSSLFAFSHGGQIGSEFDEDFVYVEPCSQHSSVSIEEVNNSAIAHNIRVTEWQSTLEFLINKADELCASPSLEMIKAFGAQARERAGRLPALKLKCFDENSDEQDGERDEKEVVESLSGKGMTLR